MAAPEGRYTAAQERRDARAVHLFLNRPRGARRIPSPDEAYCAGARLLDARGVTVTLNGWTAHAMRAALREAGISL